MHENVTQSDGITAPDGKILTVGPKGGLKYDSAIDAISARMKLNRPTNSHPPTYVIIGPGVDMAFFRKDGGFDIRYNGPYCEEAISMAKAMAKSGSKFKEIIDELCKEFNCKIQNEDN